MATKDKGWGKVGQPCIVTSGPNAGKTGTYTRDEWGNLWCEGDWGGTECGEDKCDDAAGSGTTVHDYIDAAGRNVIEVEGDFTDAQGSPFHGKVVLDAGSLKSISALSARVSPAPVDGVDLGSPELNKSVAKALKDAATGSE